MRALLCLIAASIPLLAQTAPGHCASAQPPAGTVSNHWTGWGEGTANTRYQASTSLSASNVPQLKLKWAFGFPGARSVMGQPATSGGRLFIGVDTGDVYALDPDSGCQYWSYKADASVRTAINVVGAGGKSLAIFGDLRANVYAVDASTGALQWKVKADDHATARITAAPQVYDGRIYVPISSGEEGSGGGATYACCTFRGSVVALEVATGKQVWKSYVIPEEPKEVGKTATGIAKLAPSGGAVWNTPTIDPKRKALYIGTGDAYSDPASKYTDAVTALDLATGKILWSVQDTANDVWLAACMGGKKPEHCGPDQDFGSPPMLKTLADGKDILIAGQKSGNVWAHDPDNGGKVLWRTPLVSNTEEFGGKIIWGGAADNDTAYFGLGPGGIGAVAIRNGEKKWFTDLKPVTGMETHPGQDGPLAAIPGVVFSGGWDGVLRALSSSTGKVIWEYNTAHEFETINKVTAKGGSMGAAGPIIVGKTLFVPSGYLGVRSGVGGNVLLAFEVGE